MTDWVHSQKDKSNSTLSCKAATVISWHDAKHTCFFPRHSVNSFLTGAEFTKGCSRRNMGQLRMMHLRYVWKKTLPFYSEHFEIYNGNEEKILIPILK